MSSPSSTLSSVPAIKQRARVAIGEDARDRRRGTESRDDPAVVQVVRRALGAGLGRAAHEFDVRGAAAIVHPHCVFRMAQQRLLHHRGGHEHLAQPSEKGAAAGVEPGGRHVPAVDGRLDAQAGRAPAAARAYTLAAVSRVASRPGVSEQ